MPPPPSAPLTSLACPPMLPHAGGPMQHAQGMTSGQHIWGMQACTPTPVCHLIMGAALKGWRGFVKNAHRL